MKMISFVSSIFSPYFMVVTATLCTTTGVFYYGAVVSGVFKDPLLARFRVYGENSEHYPICRLLSFIAWWGVTFSLLLANTKSIPNSLAPVIFIMLALMAGGISALIRKRPGLRDAAPYWYNNLVKNSSREELRSIGYAWLRLPRKMRWRLNGDQGSFWEWVELVRLTSIYGARDPDDPWKVWS